jgi:hypothetical protein
MRLEGAEKGFWSLWAVKSRVPNYVLKPSVFQTFHQGFTSVARMRIKSKKREFIIVSDA